MRQVLGLIPSFWAVQAAEALTLDCSAWNSALSFLTLASCSNLKRTRVEGSLLRARKHSW